MHKTLIKYASMAVLLAFAGLALAQKPLVANMTDVAVPQRPTNNDAYMKARTNQEHWCATDAIWSERRAMFYGKDNYNKAGCPTEGGCDVPSTRDATSIDPLDMNVIVHVMRDSNGNGGVSQATVDASIAQMNNDFAGTGINFNLVATRFHNDNNYSCIAAYSYSGRWAQDIANMKATYAESPESQLNIYVSCQDSGGFGTLLGIATFPWDPDALTSQGGLWMNNIAMGAGAHTLTHETGHCLGLWHTHHGVSEVSSCSDCYEFASGFEGDIRGDFASDTPPTPTNYNCSGPGGSDCQGTLWGATQPENFMGYGPDFCMDTFTPQQTSRMQCWTKDVLSGWYGATPPPPSGVTLTANGYKVQGAHVIDLSWSGAGTTNVEIYRNGALLTTTANDGAYTDATGNKGGGSYTYDVCETGGGVCSNTVTVNF